jgi:hypothetical protein
MPESGGLMNDTILIHLTEQVFQCQAGSLSTGVRFVISLTEFGGNAVIRDS